jgi:hypothetical protein
MCVKLDLTVSSTLIMMMQSLYPYIVVVDLTKLFSGKLCQSSNNLHKDHLLSEYSETSLGEMKHLWEVDLVLQLEGWKYDKVN